MALKLEQIPTPLINPTERLPVKIVPIQPTGRFSALLLAFRLFSFMLAMIWQSAVRKAPAAQLAQRTRDFLEGLGGLWIKGGQLISARTDLLSPEMADQLAQLTYQAYGFSPQIAREVVEKSLGKSVEEVFDIWGEAPIAAASISQVHRARLRYNQAWVAVKVQRPGIEAVFARDLKLITWMLRQFKWIPATSFIDWTAMSRELERIMHEEIDYRYEVSNLYRMRKLLKKHKVYVPKPYRQLCGREIIVMEFIPGVLMTDYLTLQRTNPARLHSWCRENNIKPRRVGNRLLHSLYRQLFEDRIFHGDLHPGNIMLLRGSRFALIDLGTIGTLEERFLKIYVSIARGLASGDHTQAVYGYLKMAEPVPSIDLVPYMTEMIEAARAWEARTHLDGLTYHERSATGGAASEMGAVAAKYRIGTSWQVLRLARSMNTLDANVSALVGKTNPNKIVKSYFKEAEKRRIKRLRKTGLRSLAGKVAEWQETSTYLFDLVRRQSIVFQGVQTKVAYFSGVVFNIARLGILIAGVILLYDFLHQHHFNLIASWYDAGSILGGWAERIPPMAYELGVILLILVAIAFFVTGRVKKRLAAPIPRLPGGRLDT